MRRLLFAGGAVLLLVPHDFGSTDFSGTWVLDLRAFNSPDQILKRLGASCVERQLGSSVQLESTYFQTPHLLTVHIRGPAFQRTDLIRINNQPETKEEPRTGRYTIRTWWSGHHSKAGGGGNITLRVWAAHRDAGTAAHSLETRT
jgi:hypothetical protein